jgi:hypothetical protein
MMTSTKNLPEYYVLRQEINLQKDQALLIKLNLWGLAALPLVGYILLRAGVAFHPEFQSIFEVLTPRLPIFTLILSLVLGMTSITVLHELVHGVCFWVITRRLPKFGFRGAYAFAAAPDWYIRRDAYVLVGAAPLVILSIIGLICIPIIPSQFMLPWLFCLLANASGSVGDVYILADLRQMPATALIQDQGDRISIYTETSE